MKIALAWSDIKLSHMQHQSKRPERPSPSEQEFSLKMAYYYAESDNFVDDAGGETDNEQTEIDSSFETDSEDSDQDI